MIDRANKLPIPVEFLLQMGTCNVTIHGVKVTTHVADCIGVVDKHIAELRSCLESKTKVVGLDVKKLKHSSTTHAIVLCVHRRCLIIHVDYLANNIFRKAPESIYNFINDPKICFVGVTDLRSYYDVNFSNTNVGVKVGDLAARLMKKPALIGSSLGEIAHQVGVMYDGPTSATPEIELDKRNPRVFTDEHVVAAVSDAYAYYQIGYKLLTDL